MRPHRSIANSTIRCGASSAVRSTARVATRSSSLISCRSSASLPSSRPVPSTAIPASASLVAHPKPMPLLAPVTIATCISHIHFRQPRPDLMLQHLARVILRQGIPDLHSFRNFELGHAFAHQQLAYTVEVRRRLVGGHNDRARAFAGALVGDTDDCDLRNARVADQDVLDLLGGDVLSVADDDVLGPARDHQILVVDPTAQIPCAEVTLLVEGLRLI